MGNFKELIEGEQPVLVDFYATWCGPCKIMHPILEELKKQKGDKVRIVKIDIDSPENRSLVALYHVQSVPTLFLFKKGEIKWKQVGAIGIDVLNHVVEENA